MKNISLSIAILLNFVGLSTLAQCEADHTIIINNFEFVPSELTITPGETVAFVNIESEHTLNGITNSILMNLIITLQNFLDNHCDVDSLYGCVSSIRSVLFDVCRICPAV